MKIIIYISNGFFCISSIDKHSKYSFTKINGKTDELKKYVETVNFFKNQEVLMVISAKLYYNNIVNLPFSERETILKVLPNIILDEHFQKSEEQKFLATIHSIDKKSNNINAVLINYINEKYIKELLVIFQNAKIKGIMPAHLFILSLAKLKNKNIEECKYWRCCDENIVYSYEFDENSKLKFFRSILAEIGEEAIDISELISALKKSEYDILIKQNESNFIKPNFYDKKKIAIGEFLKSQINRNTAILLILLFAALTIYIFAARYKIKKDYLALAQYYNNLIKDNFSELKIIVKPEKQINDILERSYNNHNIIIQHTSLYIDYKNILNNIFLVFERYEIIVNKIVINSNIMTISGEGKTLGDMDKIRIELLNVVPEIFEARILKSNYKNIITNTGAEFEIQLFLKDKTIKK